MQKNGARVLNAVWNTGWALFLTRPVGCFRTVRIGDGEDTGNANFHCRGFCLFLNAQQSAS